MVGCWASRVFLALALADGSRFTSQYEMAAALTEDAFQINWPVVIDNVRRPNRCADKKSFVLFWRSGRLEEFQIRYALSFRIASLFYAICCLLLCRRNFGIYFADWISAKDCAQFFGRISILFWFSDWNVFARWGIFVCELMEYLKEFSVRTLNNRVIFSTMTISLI